LVGLKKDLRKNDDNKFVTESEGYEVSKKIGAVKYLECSSLDQHGLKQVFEEVFSIAIKN